MNRALFTTAIAALGMTMFATAQIRADGHSHNGSGHPSGSANHQVVSSGRHGEIGHSYRASGRFDYGRHGFKSLSWTHYGWSDRYRTYCYWEPRYGWCFYEPSYGYYLPISNYSEVYPQATFTSAPAVVQQTSVFVAAPQAPPIDVPVGPVAPAVVQRTKVAVGTGGPVVDLPTPPPGPVGPPNQGVVQQSRVNAGIP